MASQWTITDHWKNKPQGQVWRVTDQLGRRGFFKFAYDRQWYHAGPIVGNEWLSYQLGKEVGLPVAEVEVASIPYNDAVLPGIVSLPKERVHLTSWNALPDDIKLAAEKHVCQCSLLMGAVAFDVWLTNIDRGSGKNIMLYDGGRKCLNWYLIDHGYSLYGSPRKWARHDPTSAYWHDVWRFYHVPRGWQRLANKDALMTMADRIKEISDARLEKLVHGVPDPGYSAHVKESVLSMLKHRKRVLHRDLENWLSYPGEKESRA